MISRGLTSVAMVIPAEVPAKVPPARVSVCAL